MKIYVASSWRNNYQQQIVCLLREQTAHEVYDFRHPREDNHGFGWHNIDPLWQDWSHEKFRDALTHPIAEYGFKLDFDAMCKADMCVLVLPCGRSAHSEAGYMAGQGKPVLVYAHRSDEPLEPELMYKLFTGLVFTRNELLIRIEDIESKKAEKL